MDYTKWTTEELVRLQAMVGAEDAGQDERDAIARELQRRQSAVPPEPARAQPAASPATSSTLAVENETGDEEESADESRRETNRKILIGIGMVVIAVVAIWGGAALLTPDLASGDESGSSLERHTRDYVAEASGCEAGAEAALQPDDSASDFDIADNVTQARDICEETRSKLLDLNTDHFDDEATEVWNGVDRMKSGLNAFLAYMGDESPAKLVEARNKLVEGRSAIDDGIAKINSIRAAHGLAGI